MALILNLEPGEVISFNNGILIRCEIVDYHGKSLRVSIECPRDIIINRLDKNFNIKRKTPEKNDKP